MRYKLKNKYFWEFKSSIKLYFFVIIVSITMYYDEEHCKLFTAFNHQVIKELACSWLSVGREHFFAGADPGVFLGGGVLVSCSTSTPIKHIGFFWRNTSCIRKPEVISGGGVGLRCAPPALSPLCPLLLWMANSFPSCCDEWKRHSEQIQGSSLRDGWRLGT